MSPAFASAIARRFRRGCRDPTGPLDFVEAGAGEGRFLEDFAAALRSQDPAFSERVRFTAVERSAAGRASLEKLRLPAAPRILESAEELAEGSVTGWIFSNELYDALPVVRVVGTPRGTARAARGSSKVASFAWVRAPAPPAFAEHLARFGVTLEPRPAGRDLV